MSADPFDDVEVPDGLNTETGELPPEEEAEVEDQYAGVADFVHEWLIPTFQKPTNSRGKFRWCPYWWEHDEARRVLIALWRAWEKAYADDEMAGWFRDLGYPLFDRLLGDDGPFVRCNPEPGPDYQHNPDRDMRKLTTVDPPPVIED